MTPRESIPFFSLNEINVKIIEYFLIDLIANVKMFQQFYDKLNILYFYFFYECEWLALQLHFERATVLCVYVRMVYSFDYERWRFY